MSEFVISIARLDGGKVLLKPGGQRERELIASVTNAAVAKGVGVFRTERQVRDAIGQAFDEVLLTMKTEVQPR